jgi:hypothetical protein
MKTVVVLICALLLAGLTQAQDIYTASKRQARRAVANTEAASNQDPDAQQPQSAAQAPAPQPMDPALAATLKNIASLRADLLSLNTNTPPSDALTNDLTAAASGTKPSADAVAKLAGDLQTAIAGKPALRAHYQKLAQYLHAVFNGSHLTPAQFQAISDDTEQILSNNGASYESTEAVVHDLKALFRATQSS